MAWGPRQVGGDLNIKIVRLPAGPAQSTLKTLFNIVEERFKQLLNFDVSAV